MPSWSFSPSTGRYVDTDTGRFLTNDQARGYVSDAISVATNRSDSLATMVGAEPPLVSPADWREAMRQELKQQYIKEYLLGRGGRPQMEQRDWGSIGGMLAEQYRLLNDFVAEIEAGTLSEAQIRARSQMYMKSSREAYERATQRVQEAMGMDEELWVLGVADHCVDCVAFANLGWQLIGDDAFNGATPGSGNTVCLTNCNCHKEFRQSETRAIVRLVRAIHEIIRLGRMQPGGMRG